MPLPPELVSLSSFVEAKISDTLASAFEPALNMSSGGLSNRLSVSVVLLGAETCEVNRSSFLDGPVVLEENKSSFLTAGFVAVLPPLNKSLKFPDFSWKISDVDRVLPVPLDANRSSPTVTATLLAAFLELNNPVSLEISSSILSIREGCVVLSDGGGLKSSNKELETFPVGLLVREAGSDWVGSGPLEEPRDRLEGGLFPAGLWARFCLCVCV